MSKLPRGMQDPNLLSFKYIVLSMVRNEEIFFDLTDRQRAVMLVVYTETPAQGHTVRGLANNLQIERPAISRALDRLTEIALVERRPDPLDGRSVVVGTTAAGHLYIRALRSHLGAAQRETTKIMSQGPPPGRYRKSSQRPEVGPG